MQIQTIEQKTGLDRATIRYYETEGLICPQRLQNGYRDYSESNLQDLLKVKLLRQLGLSLEAISQLIEGKENLRSVLENQLVVLKDHKTQVENAEAVCRMIMQDNVTYSTFDPNKYYSMPNKKTELENRIEETPYVEYVYLESHPIRRFVGRYLDQILISAILMLVIVVLFRVRPFGDVQNNLLSIAATFLTMPLNALFLCLLGTTPGKFAVGIFLKTPDGKNMTFLNALRREWAVFRYGMGFLIPVYSWVRLYKSYSIHTEGRELEWDYDYNADVLYTEWDAKRWFSSVALSILCVISIFYATMDSQFPKHRNPELTLAQFAENYNDYAKQSDMISYLSEEGEWYNLKTHPNSVVVDSGDTTEYWHFITDDKQVLEQISIKGTTSSGLFLFATGKIPNAIRTLILSQPNADLYAVDEMTNTFSEAAFISRSGSREYNFGGVIVKTECKQMAMIYSFTVDIFVP